MKSKPTIDWDTVELVERLQPRSPRPFPVPEPDWARERRGRSIVKKILSGAATKARSRGAIYTHTQICGLLPAGLDRFFYGCWLLIAAVEGSLDISRGVEVAANAIWETGRQIADRRAKSTLQ